MDTNNKGAAERSEVSRIKLSKTQEAQLSDIVRATRLTRGKNSGKRKDDSLEVDHFDWRSFSGLISKKLVTSSEHGSGWYATELGYNVWKGL